MAKIRFDPAFFIHVQDSANGRKQKQKKVLFLKADFEPAATWRASTKGPSTTMRLAQSSVAHAWSFLVEEDEQLDWPNSQTTMELCHVLVA